MFAGSDAQKRPVPAWLSRLFALDASARAGLLLVVCAALALIWSSSPYTDSYTQLWQTPLVVGLGEAVLNKPLFLWINDGLTATSFLLVGLLTGSALAAGLGVMVLWLATEQRSSAPEPGEGTLPMQSGAWKTNVHPTKVETRIERANRRVIPEIDLSESGLRHTHTEPDSSKLVSSANYGATLRNPLPRRGLPERASVWLHSVPLSVCLTARGRGAAKGRETQCLHPGSADGGVHRLRPTGVL